MSLEHKIHIFSQPCNVENVENNSTDTLFKMEINSNIVFKLRNNSSIPLAKDLESVL